MTWQKGTSGNPAGRAPGSKNLRTRLRQELEKDGSALAAAIKQRALEDGDTTAMSLWLARLEPPLRPAAQRVQFKLDVDAPIAGQAKQVVQAVARGEVDPDTGKQLLDMLSALVGLRDIETFLSELRKLRESHSNGGVVTT